MPDGESHPPAAPFHAAPEAFSFLNDINALPGVRAGWIERVNGLSIQGGRDQAMCQLRPFHEAAIDAFGVKSTAWWRAEQVHGSKVAVVPCPDVVMAADELPLVPGMDGLLTKKTGVVLAVYVADCGAIWLADRKTGAIGLLHSGKKGTESNILRNAVQLMMRDFGTNPQDLLAVLSPCIRPPDYEVDFAAQIEAQAEQVGIGNFIDCGLNTASDLRRFYSYRKELGTTGRMMALITRDTLP